MNNTIDIVVEKENGSLVLRFPAEAREIALRFARYEQDRKELYETKAHLVKLVYACRNEGFIGRWAAISRASLFLGWIS